MVYGHFSMVFRRWTMDDGQWRLYIRGNLGKLITQPCKEEPSLNRLPLWQAGQVFLF